MSTRKVNRFIYPILAICLCGFSISIAVLRGDPGELIAGLLAFSLLPSALYALIALLSKLFIKNDILAIFTSLSITFLFIYKAFRIMHWPGSMIFLALGLVLAVFAIGFALTKKVREKD